MSQYHLNEIEKKWRQKWSSEKTYKVVEDPEKEKYYVLDMFPYPSGAGLHVGHPLGYIASDIYARYKRLKGFNVLHPMGYDSFGLPAEQYAIQTGQHPAITTKKNIERYRDQLDKIGFSFDWDREVRTSDPNYYKWTQWIFLKLFNSWYNQSADKAEPIESLTAIFEKDGNKNVQAATSQKEIFNAEKWNNYGEQKQQEILLNYRLAYLSESMVNWCPALGTVLANDEVKDGVSERGGHPVEQKKMMQWSLRITAYAQRLLDDLESLDWTDAIKEIQRNWIGRSEGASVFFEVANSDKKIEVFTTRPDTIFGVSFMVLAPEHELVDEITTPEQKETVNAYKKAAALKSERDRQSDVKNITGAFTGAYAIHPFTGDKVPIWIGDYVLVSYGTGAVMAVPCGDQRDWDFARHFGIEIKNIFKDIDISEGAYSEKDAVITNSDFLNDLPAKKAIKTAIYEIETRGLGKGKIQYRLRDAIFSRQRYWGEPIPMYYKEGIPYPVDEKDLPLELPEVDKFLPTEKGEPPLARAKNWTYKGFPLETNTMPGFAGSSWYFMRYTDPKNPNVFAAKEKLDYWKNVDLYVGGAEHATGHLLYARFFTKVLYDLGLCPYNEPFKKMINQGMIQGVSEILTRYDFKQVIDKKTNEHGQQIDIFSEESLFRLGSYKESFKQINHIKINDKDWKCVSILPFIRIPIEYVENHRLYRDKFIKLKENDNRFNDWDLDTEVIWETDENGKKYITLKPEVEKMSKSKFNVQTPDELVEKYGADTLRCYEMFLGPVEQHKPWDTKGIEGVNRFLKKFWRLFFNENGTFEVSHEAPTKEEWKVWHKNLKKITEDLERYSFNTVVSQFMILTNELTDLKCNKSAILKPALIALSPYAPHIAEELWHLIHGNENVTSVTQQSFPVYDESFLVESAHKYPVSFNGKMRFLLELPLDLSKEQIEKEVLNYEQTQKYLDGKSPKKVIVVPKKIVNIVV